MGRRSFERSPAGLSSCQWHSAAGTTLDEIVRGMREFDDELKVYCLKAGMLTILKRLEQRGAKIEGGESNWIIRKSQECIEVHQDANFGEAVNTEGVSAVEVAKDILRRLEYTNTLAK